MAGLIFFNLSENQFVHVAARLQSRALHHTSIDLVCLSKALCWMLVIRNCYTEINECIDGWIGEEEMEEALKKCNQV